MKRFTLNKNKSIGKVLFIVEGNKTEIELIAHIFSQLCDYQCEKLDRLGRYYKFQSQTNPHSRVFVINTEKTHIKSIKEGSAYLDHIYEMLINDYEFPVSQSAIFYIFDRDPYSNRDVEGLRELLKELGNSRENEFTPGLLLLSYPALEAFILSNFKEVGHLRFELGKQLKQYLRQEKISDLRKINEKSLLHAAREFEIGLQRLGIKTYDLDDLSETNVAVFDQQEAINKNIGKYYVLSLLSMALMDLGILVEEEEIVP